LIWPREPVQNSDRNHAGDRQNQKQGKNREPRTSYVLHVTSLIGKRLTMKAESEGHKVENSCVPWIATGAASRGTRA
jgi:hypothetical protein